MKEHTILRNDWTREEIEQIYNLPLLELIYKAATVHREWHNPEEVQMSTLLSIKPADALKTVLIADRLQGIIPILKYRPYYRQKLLLNTPKGKRRRLFKVLYGGGMERGTQQS